MKKLVKAGLLALSASGAFGTAASAQDGWEGRPFYFNSIVGLLHSQGLSRDQVQWDQMYPRDAVGVNDCYDRNGDGVADRHGSSGQTTWGGQTIDGGPATDWSGQRIEREANPNTGGPIMSGGDYRYTLMIVTGDSEDHVTPHFGVTMEEAVEAINSIEREPLTAIAMGVLFNQHREIVRMYYATSQEGDSTLSIEQVARPNSTNPLGPSSNPAVSCSTLRQ